MADEFDLVAHDVDSKDSPLRPDTIPRPNVLLIISDQQRYDTLGCTGQPRISTPNIDRLAADGTLFERAFCTTPICTPARASLLSGLYPHSHGSVANHQMRPGCDQMRLDPAVRLVADYLKLAGYLCGYAGKWHLGTGYDRRGFSDFAAAHFIFDVDNPEQNEIVQHARKMGIAVTDSHQGGIEPDGERYDSRIRSGPSLLGLANHPASLMCDRAVEFIHDAATKGQPFVLGWSCHEPHQPFVCPEPFISMYKPDDMVLPESRRDEHAVRYLKERRKDGVLTPIGGLSDHDLQIMWAGYFGAVSYVDYLVGRLISALHRENLYDDTLIIFTSDHGELLGSHGMWRKGSAMFEELIHIPLIIVPPGGGRIQGRSRYRGRCGELVSHVDLMPTILECCGASVPDGLHGVSISSLSGGGTDPVRPGIAGEFHSANWAACPVLPLRMWRTKEFKYVESQMGDSELYDLTADPQERNNVIDDPASQGKLAEMKDELSRWLKRTEDTWPEVAQPPPEYLRSAD